ncbi:hypothetical protein ES288_D09G220000v1 [Gossypium darwinii]|uniref:Uncharacterized protein n=1 Tax=Gossypium darwinii TaxID=34276 RepID=A0A5D2BCW2_GOSDA|nr:hypothetical protein ES288_D09G220000v1 [Gossypium darwinii]
MISPKKNPPEFNPSFPHRRVDWTSTTHRPSGSFSFFCFLSHMSSSSSSHLPFPPFKFPLPFLPHIAISSIKSLQIHTPKQLIDCQIAASSFPPTSIPLLFTMMMSMFSSFEALLFDSHTQKKYTATSTPIEKAKPNEVSCSEGNKKETTEFNNLSPPPSSSSVVKTPQKQRLRPRFAPELDGVHCFETIIPY